MYQDFWSQVAVVQEGGGSAVLLWLVSNAHVSGAAHQTSEDLDIRQEQ